MNGGPADRILMVLTEAIGDVLLSTPAVRAIRKDYPDAFLSYVVGKRARAILDNNPYLDELIVVDESDVSLSGAVKLFRKVRPQRFTALVQFTPYRKYHLLGFLSRIPLRIGLDRVGWPWTHNRAIASSQISDLHRSDYYLAFARALGVEPDGPRLDFVLSTQAETAAGTSFEAAHLRTEDMVIGIHPATSAKNRRERQWSARSFRDLIDAILRRGHKVMLFDGPGYPALTEEIWSRSDSRVAVTPAPDLMQLGALMKRCRMIISLDSAPAHIATALEIPRLVLFSGITSPKHWAPQYGTYRVLQKQNIQDISVCEVLNNLESLLAQDGPK